MNVVYLGLSMILNLLAFSTFANEQEKTYIFINSDIQQHQSTINQLNSVLLKAQSLEQRIFVVDIAETEKDFRGEVTYVHDKDGAYLAQLMPRQIPEVVEVYSGDIVQYYPLDFYGLNLINALVTTNQEDKNEE